MMTPTCNQCKNTNNCRKKETLEHYVRCENFEYKKSIILNNAECSLCEYMLMDEYCQYHKQYTFLKNLCAHFEACEEYRKGMIGW